MPRRIDIDGGDAENEIAEALRQLGRKREAVDRETELKRAVQEVAEQQKAAAPVPPPGRRPTSPWAARAAWIGIAVVALGLIGAVFALMKPEPPPPTARTAEEAVRQFWTCLIEGRYEAAVHYYPAMQTRYGSTGQAAEQLREVFQQDPPTVIRLIEEAEPVPDSSALRVRYEVYKKSGQPRVGEFLVTGSSTTGFIIITGGV